MTKLTEYVEIAADEYVLETGDIELTPQWIADFFEFSGLTQEHPRENLLNFAYLVQKQLIRKDRWAEKLAKCELGRIAHLKCPPGAYKSGPLWG